MAGLMHSLPLFHRLAGAKVVVAGEGDVAAAKRRQVERAGGVCCTEGQAQGARLALVAIENRAQAEAAARRLKAQGLLVNVADRPELCDFTLPSVLERGEVLVAVSTGGASAALAKQLRLRLETLLPSSIENLAAGLRSARDAVRARWPDPAERRRALDAALAQGGPLDPLAARARDGIGAWLAAPKAGEAPSTVEIVLASDDPDDLTLRQARLLGTADTLVHDPGVPPAILARARADAARLPRTEQDAPPGPGLTVILRSAAR